MDFPESQPSVELVGGEAKPFTEVFHRIKSRKVFPKETQDKEQAVARVRDDEIRENGMCVSAAVTDDAKDTEIGLHRMTALQIYNGSSVVGMDVTVSGRTTDGTGFQFRLKLSHKGIKKEFR